ncbi:uncharacterized protein M6B38_312345 [Iris pallida]|uniref:Trimethylguanosine synthase n=1 Tax=Iris pallida TaxID=29817 RepID=A0AAX6HGN2_IRIPA|nr:uncharacterized protein M6B38_312345 [Iris pallida]
MLWVYLFPSGQLRRQQKNVYTKGKKKGAHAKSVSSDNIVCEVKDRQLEDIASSIILHDRTHVPSSCETAEGDSEGNHHNTIGERSRGSLLFDEELVGVDADVLGGNDKKHVSDEMTDVLIDNHVVKDPIPDETDVGMSLDQLLIANGGSCLQKVSEDATYGFEQEGESINKQSQNNYFEDSSSTLLDIAHAINNSSTLCPSSTESSLFSAQIDHEIPECPDNSVLCEFGEWRVVWDSFYKRNYFYNCQSKESTWYPPLGLEHFTYSCSTSNSNEMFADATGVDACLGIVYDGIQDKNIHDIESTKLFEESENAFECLNQSSQEISCELSGLTVNYEFEDPDSRPTLCEIGKGRASSKLLDVNDHAIDSDIECFDSQEKNDMYNDKLSVPDIPVELTVSSLITTLVEVDDEENMNTLPEKYLTTTMNELDCHDIAYKERKKRVRRSQMQTILQEIVTSLPTNIVKYWCQRYSLFSRFDCGIKMDEEGWFSVTPEPIARHHASRFASGTVIDCFSGVGGNAIQFALRCNHVIAIDIDPQKVEYARHNAAIYGVNDRIDFLIGDFFKIAARLKADTIFLSPPWGGPDYNKVETYDMRSMLKPCDGHVLFNAARIIASKVVMFLPRNVNLNQLAELSLSVSPPWALEVEKNYLNGKLKAITAYFDRPTT